MQKNLIFHLKVSTQFSKLLFEYEEICSEGKNFSDRRFFLRTFAFLANTLWLVCQKCFLCVQRYEKIVAISFNMSKETSWGKVWFEKKYLKIECFSTLDDYFLANVSKLCSTSAGKEIELTQFLKHMWAQISVAKIGKNLSSAVSEVPSTFPHKVFEESVCTFKTNVFTIQLQFTCKIISIFGMIVSTVWSKMHSAYGAKCSEGKNYRTEAFE